MTLSSIVALFSAMVILAAVPSVSVLTVSTRSATFGLIHGVFVAVGIVLGDVVFVIIAIQGLSFLAEALGNLFSLLRLLSGAYLVVLGIRLYQSISSSDVQINEVRQSSLLSSFLAGLLITLGDQKAILFYLGFFPAFVNTSQVSKLETIVIVVTTIVAVGSVKLSYALMAHHIRFLFSPRISKGITAIASCAVIAVGVFLIIQNLPP